jgi:hypothetical protein
MQELFSTIFNVEIRRDIQIHIQIGGMGEFVAFQTIRTSQTGKPIKKRWLAARGSQDAGGR